ncbi:hypothetical protein GCM10009121_21760 [Rhodanobacter soli]
MFDGGVVAQQAFEETNAIHQRVSVHASLPALWDGAAAPSPWIYMDIPADPAGILRCTAQR